MAAHPPSKSGIKRVDAFEVSDLPCKIAGSIPRGDGTDGTYNPDQWMEPKEQRKVDHFIVYAMAAAKQAVRGFRLDAPQRMKTRSATGVHDRLRHRRCGGYCRDIAGAEGKGPRRISPFFIPGRLINLASGYVSIEYGLKGPNHAVVTACSTGSHAIGDAGRLIALAMPM